MRAKDEGGMNAREASAAACRARLVPLIPTLRAGDRWRGVWGREVTIVGASSAEGWEWPQVSVTGIGDKAFELGAPAFMGAELLERGRGPVLWRQQKAEAA
jgi:hypothetical protein